MPALIRKRLKLKIRYLHASNSIFRKSTESKIQLCITSIFESEKISIQISKLSQKSEKKMMKLVNIFQTI